MAVTWFALPDRPRVELMVIDPYTFREWEDAMLAAMERPELPDDLLVLIDRRGAARPTNGFIKSMVDFFRAHEARLAGARAAVLVSSDHGIEQGTRMTEPLFDLRVGRFRIRSFNDAAAAVQWLGPDWDDRTSPCCASASSSSNVGASS